LAISDFESQISNLKSLAESCSRQLRGWAESLQESDIKGQRHLTSKTRQQEAESKRAEAFRKVLLTRLPPGHPLRKDAEERGWL